MGRLHVENITSFIPRLEIVAAADVAIDASREWLESKGIKELYTDYRDLLKNDDIEAVIIASATDTHKEIAIAAAEAKKQIFCEKPIDQAVVNNEEVVRAIESAGVLFQVGFNRRFDHNFARVRQLVEDGSIGEVQIIRISSRDPAPPPLHYLKVSGGLFLDMMIHDFDMVRYLSGMEVRRVTAHGANLIDPKIKEEGDIDTAVVTLELSNGALAVIDNSRQAVYGYDQRVEVFGSKGQAVAYNDAPNNVELYSEDAIRKDKIYYFYLDRYTRAFVDQFNTFADALEGKRGGPGVIDGLRAVEIGVAAGQSLREGKTVEL
ncbi:MAG: inositol 2-dehydrogenase [Clostridia bacterium]|nr:inositol 2-dehydrogenase [Clostridia bacterium]